MARASESETEVWVWKSLLGREMSTDVHILSFYAKLEVHPCYHGFQYKMPVM